MYLCTERKNLSGVTISKTPLTCASTSGQRVPQIWI